MNMNSGTAIQGQMSIPRSQATEDWGDLRCLSM